MGGADVAVASVLMGVPGIIAFTAMMMRFNLKKRELELRDGDSELEHVVEELRGDLNETRAQLTEMQERLDFAERLLTAGRAKTDRGDA